MIHKLPPKIILLEFKAIKLHMLQRMDENYLHTAGTIDRYTKILRMGKRGCKLYSKHLPPQLQATWTLNWALG